MKITITIANQISDCCNAWDDFLPAQHHLQSRHLQAFENARTEDVENYYLQVFLKEKLIGLVYLQQFQFRHRHLNFNRPATFLSKLLELILPEHLPLLICGNLFRIDFQGFYFINHVHDHLVCDVIRLFTKQHKPRPYGIIIKDCPAVFSDEYAKQSLFHFFKGDVTMELSRRANWLSFDDYLKDLHKNYLQRAKKIIRDFSPVESKELDADGIMQQAAAIDTLYWNVVNRQTVKLGTVKPGYFYELKKDLAHNFEFHALYHNNVMVGFYTFIFYESGMETHYIGLDYEANKQFKLYFNILFLSTRKMIDRQDNKLELGRTAREAKVNLGALPKQIFNYIKMSNPVIKMTVYYFLKRFNKTPDHNLVERTPLK